MAWKEHKRRRTARKFDTTWSQDMSLRCPGSWGPEQVFRRVVDIAMEEGASRELALVVARVAAEHRLVARPMDETDRTRTMKRNRVTSREKRIRLSVIIPNRVRANGSWKDYIKGEWWIDSSGRSMFADQDLGEAGHEQIAINNMIDRNVLFEELARWYRSKAPLSEGWSRREADERADELLSMLESGSEPAEVILNDYVADSVGAKSAGGMAKWKALKEDARKAYAKYEGAILAIDRNFAAWRVTESTISAIQSFIEEQAEGDDEIDDMGTKVCVEQFEPQKYGCMPVADFLLIRKPKELWG